MADRTLPGIGLKGFWALGEDNWKTDMDANLLALSVLVQGRALSLVNADPGAPADGDVYLFGSTHPTQANKLAVRDNGAWTYLTPLAGWRFYNIGTSGFYQFNGVTWTPDTAQLTAEDVRDVIAAALVQGTNVTIVNNDPGDTITISAAGGGSTDEQIQDMIATFLQQGTNVTLTYDDAGNHLTIAASGGSSSGGGSTTASRVSAQYWRVRFLGLRTDNSTTQASGLSELIFKDAVGTTLSTGGAAIASSTNSGSTPASNAFDGSTATAWYTQNGRNIGEWIGYNFGSAKAVASFTINPDPGFVAGMPVNFALDYSSDGVEWFMHSSYFTNGWVANTPQTFSVPAVAVASATGSLVQLAQTVLTAASASVDFTGLAQGYEDLVIVINGQLSGTADFVVVRANGDNGVNYQYARGVFQSSGLSYTSNTATGFVIGLMGGAAAGASYADMVEAVIQGYARTTFYKNARGRSTLRSGSAASAMTIEETIADWLNTAAINRLTFIPNSGNFTAGTVFTIYGRGGGVAGASGKPWYFNPPIAANFTGLSYDATLPTATDDADVGMMMNFGNSVAGDKTRILQTPIPTPAADWTWTTRIDWFAPRSNYQYGAIIVRDSATGKFLQMGPIEDGGGAMVFNGMPGLTTNTGGSNPSWSGTGGFGGNIREYPKFYKVHFDNASGIIYFYLSHDGKNWVLAGQDVYTRYLTNKPTHVGYGITSNQQGGTFYNLRMTAQMSVLTQP